jgi:hypothetical protein
VKADWRATKAGAVAAAHIRAWIDLCLEDVRTGQFATARDALAVVYGWWADREMRAVPADVAKELESWFVVACDALRDPIIGEAAENALKCARQLVTPGTNGDDRGDRSATTSSGWAPQ